MKINPKNLTFINGHKKSATCVALDGANEVAYTASKDGCLMKWDLKTNKKTVFGKKQHRGQISSIALSSDSMFLVSGGRDKLIKIWNPESLELMDTFKGHTGEITVIYFCFPN
jgi:ribosomal RNA-processing protein 9